MNKTYAVLAVFAASGSFVGCTTNETSVQANLAPAPPENLVFADTATPVRDWPQSTSFVQNGDSQGDGSIGFRYRTADNLPSWGYPLAEPGVFVANVVTLPYTLIEQRNDSHISAGVQFTPSYTVMPALPGPNVPIAPEAPTQPTPAGEAPIANAVDAPAPMPVAEMSADDSASDVLSPTTTQPGAPAFTIAGQVLRPGSYSANETRLSQVVLAAGPSSTDPTKVRVQIDRPGEESASTTLAELQSGNVDDVVVKSGDVITISVLP